MELLRCSECWDSSKTVEDRALRVVRKSGVTYRDLYVVTGVSEEGSFYYVAPDRQYQGKKRLFCSFCGTPFQDVSDEYRRPDVCSCKDPAEPYAYYCYKCGGPSPAYPSLHGAACACAGCEKKRAKVRS